MKYRFLLFDADNTILDFDKSERQALQIALENKGLHFDDEVLQTYCKNNLFMWEKLERQEVTKDEVLIGRFLLTAQQLNWNCDVSSVAKIYEEKLHNGYFVVENAHTLLQTLTKSGYQLYLVSNGVLSIQNSRMEGSNMGQYFKKRFISEEVGYPKPQKEFFDFCFSQIEDFDKSQALIIGDSLTSDIQGGINAGIDTCWFNIHNLVNSKGFVPTYTITNLMQLLDIV